MAEDFKHILDGIVDVNLAAYRFGLPCEIPNVFDNPGCPFHIGDNIIGHRPQVVIFDLGPAV